MDHNHIITMDMNTASIRRVDRPEDSPVLVALDRLRRCPDEVVDTFWPPGKKVQGQAQFSQVPCQFQGASSVARDYWVRERATGGPGYDEGRTPAERR